MARISRKSAAPQGAGPVQGGAPQGAGPVQRGAPQGAGPVQRGAPQGAGPVQRGAPQGRKGAKSKRKIEELSEGHDSSGHIVDDFSSGVQNKVERGASDLAEAFIQNGKQAVKPVLKEYTEEIMKMQHDQDSGTFMNLSLELHETKTDLKKANEQVKKANEQVKKTNEQMRKTAEEANEAKEKLSSIQKCHICDDVSHKRLLCDDSHYMCSECAKNAVESSLSSGGTADVLKCCYPNCQKSSTTDNLRDVVPVDLYLKYMMARERVIAKRSNRNKTDFDPNCAYTPCCKKKFFDFDGCCAIFCDNCKTYFCAYCMGAAENGKSIAENQRAHHHVINCPVRKRFQKKNDDPLYARTTEQQMQIRGASAEHSMALGTGGDYVPANVPFPNLSIYHTPNP